MELITAQNKWEIKACIFLQNYVLSVAEEFRQVMWNSDFSRAGWLMRTAFGYILFRFFTGVLFCCPIWSIGLWSSPQRIHGNHTYRNKFIAFLTSTNSSQADRTAHAFHWVNTDFFYFCGSNSIYREISCDKYALLNKHSHQNQRQLLTQLQLMVFSFLINDSPNIWLSLEKGFTLGNIAQECFCNSL